MIALAIFSIACLSATLMYMMVYHTQVFVAYCAVSLVLNTALFSMVIINFGRFGAIGRAIEKFKHKHLIENNETDI